MTFYSHSKSEDYSSHSNFLFFVLSKSSNHMRDRLPSALLHRIGRKKTVLIPMLIAGVSCILVSVIPKRGTGMLINYFRGCLTGINYGNSRPDRLRICLSLRSPPYPGFGRFGITNQTQPYLHPF